MPGPDDSFDDDTIDALLAGSPHAGDGSALSSFIEDVRSAAVAVPTPSPALAAAIAAGGISTHQPQVAQWRKLHMKLKASLAGLGIAGKIALGVGVAAAATTGAGAAGVLPGPVQHAVSSAVGAFTPFSLPDGGSHGSHDGTVAAGDDSTTTSTVGDVTTTSAPSAHDGDGLGGVVTPTTTGDHHGDGETTSTTVVLGGGGNGDGNGNGNGNGNGDGTTTTTEHHGDGDNNNPESLTISCVRTADPASISCTWTGSTDPGHANYVLLRTGDGSGRVVTESADALHFTDTTVVPGTTYTYRVDSLRADNSVDSHSPQFTVECCGGTTTTTIHHEDTTTTTVHHDGDTTTTTVEHH